VRDAGLWHHALMGVNGEMLAMPDTPETRSLWLGDFSDQELRDILRKLLDVGFVELILKDNERGFRLTNLGRVGSRVVSAFALPN
jgi:hypothetical protein